jgi:hypothetical protein
MIELVNGYVLFPHAPDWDNAPEWQRTWETYFSDALTGAQSRYGVRNQPLRRLDWTVGAFDLVENSKLDDRIRAAKKSGKACVPYWGRGSKQLSATNNLTVTLDAPAWSWAVNDYIFLMDEFRNYDVRQLNAVNIGGDVLTLSLAVSRTYAAGLLCWPMLFGKLLADDMEATTNWHGQPNFGLQELKSPASTQVGVVPAVTGDGIGVWKLEDTFIVQ